MTPLPSHRHQTEDMYALAAQLDAQTPGLVPTRGLPTHVPVFGAFFDKVPTGKDRRSHAPSPVP